jgi:hypothetical protein
VCHGQEETKSHASRSKNRIFSSLGVPPGSYHTRIWRFQGVSCTIMVDKWLECNIPLTRKQSKSPFVQSNLACCSRRSQMAGMNGASTTTLFPCPRVALCIRRVRHDRSTNIERISSVHFVYTPRMMGDASNRLGVRE